MQRYMQHNRFVVLTSSLHNTQTVYGNSNLRVGQNLPSQLNFLCCLVVSDSKTITLPMQNFHRRLMTEPLKICRKFTIISPPKLHLLWNTFVYLAWIPNDKTHMGFLWGSRVASGKAAEARSLLPILLGEILYVHNTSHPPRDIPIVYFVALLTPARIYIQLVYVTGKYFDSIKISFFNIHFMYKTI